jgi:hypothetical protein
VFEELYVLRKRVVFFKEKLWVCVLKTVF